MRSARFSLCVAAFILACLYPLVADPYWLTVGILALFYAIVTSSWALLVGYAGQFSFGHMGFVSLGAYCAALLIVSFGVPLPIGMIAALVLAGLVGAVIGFTCLRMRGPYLAIFTMAFSEVFRIIVLTENQATGGAGGTGSAAAVPHPLRRAVFLPGTRAARCGAWCDGADDDIPLGSVLPRDPGE